MSTQAHPSPATAGDPRLAAFDHRLNDVGWGLFLMLIGGVWLLPDGTVSTGAWLIATGVLLLGLNVFRRIRGIPAHRVGVLLGLLAVITGMAWLADAIAPILPAALVAVGAWIVVKPLLVRGS
jgi:hypothetical protein